jgi:hypothetical protein
VSAVGRFGVSNPRTFVVDREPHAVATLGNVSAETAAPLALGGGAYAVAATPATPQYFRVELKANRRTFIECDAVAIDSKLEPVLVLSDAGGRELARGDEANPIDVTPPADGAYVVQAHDVLHRGGAEYFYRLRARTGGRVDLVLPPAIHPDAEDAFTLFGRNLPSSSAPAATAPSLDGRPLDALTAGGLGGAERDPAGLAPHWFVPRARGHARRACSGTSCWAAAAPRSWARPPRRSSPSSPATTTPPRPRSSRRRSSCTASSSRAATTTGRASTPRRARRIGSR